MAQNPPRALITGIRGFTGRYLAAELAASGYEVHGIAHTGELAGERVYTVDLCDGHGLREIVSVVKPNVVAHLAAISFVAHGNVEEIYRTNILGTRNLLEALASEYQTPGGLQAVLLASSANVYGNSTDDPITEATCPAPTNDYAVSKLSMEYMARLWVDRLPLTIVRPFNYTGIGQSQSFLLPKIVDHFRRRAPVIELGNLDVKRDFSDVRTVVAVYRRLLDVCPVGETFNVCSGIAHSLEDLLATASALSRHKIEVRVNPAFVRAGEVKCLRGSDEKLQEAIGALQRISIGDTLKWMLTAKH